MNKHTEASKKSYLKHREKTIQKRREKQRELTNLVNSGNKDFIEDCLENGFREYTKRGYVAIHRKGGRFYEHSLVWRIKNGSFDSNVFNIHHINGIKTDNRIENLQLIDKHSHTTNHLKRKDILDGDVIDGVMSGKTYRGLAKELGCTHGLIISRLRRIGYYKAGDL